MLFSWSGSPCARCGAARTADGSDALPVCAACLQRTREELARAAAPPRRCPADGATLAVDLVYGVVVAHCPDCKRMVLGDEERAVVRRAAEHVGSDLSAWAALFPPL